MHSRIWLIKYDRLWIATWREAWLAFKENKEIKMEKLRRVRKKRGLTQKQVADKLHVSRTTVTKWETGNSLPSINTLKLLTRIFKCKITDLI